VDGRGERPEDLVRVGERRGVMGTPPGTLVDRGREGGDSRNEEGSGPSLGDEVVIF
jgi:hypothetical protein